jgi:hypothetical protein
MGFKLKYDSSKVDRSKVDVEAPQPGVYKAKIESAKYEPPKDGSHPGRVVFVAKQLSADGTGKGKGYTYWDYVNVDLDWKMDNWIAAALGVDTEKKKKGTVDLDDFVGKEIRVRAKADSWQGEYKAKLASVMPPADADEDEDDEDEDEVDFDEDETEDEDDADESEDEDDEDDDDDDDEDDDDDDDDDESDDEDEDEDDEDEEDEDEDEDDEEEEEEAPAPPPAKKKKAPAPAPEPAPKAKKAAPAAAAPAATTKKKGAPKYEAMEDAEIDALLKKRKLNTKGSKTAKVARLRQFDSDPFS